MRCMIIDDDYKTAESIEKNIEALPFLQLIKKFTDIPEAIKFIYTHQVDLIFLNVDMPYVSYIQRIKNFYANTSFILTAAYIKHLNEEIELDAIDYIIELDAIDYIIKPVSFENFLKAVIKAIQVKTLRENITTNLPDNQKPLFIKNGLTLHKLDLSNILFLKKEGNYFHIHLKGNKKALIRMNFFTVFNYIPMDKFIRIHKSFIVNVDQIDLIKGQHVTIDSHEIPIGLSYKDGIMKHLKVM